MSISSSQSFDGQLIGVARGEINHLNTRLYYYGMRGGRWIQPDLLRKNPPDFAREDLKRLPPDIRSVIREGQLRVHWLIDSRGGVAMTADCIALGMEGVRERGGEVNSYGFKKMHSAAARIWWDADHRFCAESSTAVWHTRAPENNNGKNSPEIQQSQALKEIQDWIEARKREDVMAIQGVVNSIKNAGLKAAIQEKIQKDPENRMTFGLMGDHLAEEGLATTMPNHRELFALFMERSGWKPRTKASYLLDPVGRFAVRTMVPHGL